MMFSLVSTTYLIIRQVILPTYRNTLRLLIQINSKRGYYFNKLLVTAGTITVFMVSNFCFR